MQKRVAGCAVARLSTRHEPIAGVVEHRLAVLVGELLRRERVRQWLHLWTSACHDLAALYLQKTAACHVRDVLSVLFAVPLVLFVDVEQQFLQLIAR